MPDLAQVALASVTVVAVLMLVTWLISLLLRDASIVDIIWGLGFVGIAWTAAMVGDGFGGRQVLITALTTAWGIRLAGHLYVRNHGKGEDFRYRAMRSRHAQHFARWSLVNVFGMQGVLMLAVSLPLMAGQSGGPSGFNVADFIGAAVWAVGFATEATADWQLAAFRADPGSAGKVMDRGLWRYSRHPNYFGDAVAWWGIFIIALAEPRDAWCVFGPLVMTVLLTRVSGVPMLERTMSRRRPGYAEYVARTSAFIPLPRKKGR